MRRRRAGAGTAARDEPPQAGTLAAGAGATVGVVGRLAKPYPAPTVSQVPAPAVNTTVARKITASIRDMVHGIGNGLRSDSWGCGKPMYKLWMTLE
jgi:hypothetical protein